MNQNKKGASSRFFCDVCQINLASEAEHALHEFTKKHCDNLLKVAKHKPVVPKQKVPKPEPSAAKPEPPPVNVVTGGGSFARYGYFVLGEVYQTKEIPKEFNVEYDPYLQKFAENPYKEKKETPAATATFDPNLLPTVNITNFSRKKKKKIKSCQICNVTLTTVPEYETHMRSPMHTWKLKMSGMGVSAHFVKASSDLHTTELNEDSTSNELPDGDPNTNAATSQTTSGATTAFPTLFCDICELLLNSEQQYNAHVNGKSHNDMLQKKADQKAKKEKIQNPSPNQLYCYSCKLSLNNLFQYNEHKNGKKHKTKCRQLIKSGFTIPPEERLSSWDFPRINPNKPVIYPELYEKCVIEPQRQKEADLNAASIAKASTLQAEDFTNTNAQTAIINLKDGMYHCETCSLRFNTATKYEHHLKGNDHYTRMIEVKEDTSQNVKNKDENKSTDNHLFKVPKVMAVSKPAIVFHSSRNEPISQLNHVVTNIEANESNTINQSGNQGSEEVQPMEVSSEVVTDQSSNSAELTQTERTEERPSLNPTKANEPVESLTCNVCTVTFKFQTTFDSHLNTEEHAKKVIELRTQGPIDVEILKILLSDRRVVKPDKFNRHTCGICNVTSSNVTEYSQHLSSVVHKYAEIDFKKKRMIEIKASVVADENGKYYCKLCEDGFPSLLEYNQHLHCVKHKNIQREKRALIASRRRAMLLHKKRMQYKNFAGLKRGLRFWKRNCEKNPGVRTKIGGIATDLCTGAMAPVPNLEPLEPKIDPTKNVDIGVAKKTSEVNKTNDGKITKKAVKKVKRPIRKLKNKAKMSQAAGSMQGTSQNEFHNPEIPSLLGPQQIPPPMYSQAGNLPPVGPNLWPARPPGFGPVRDWAPYNVNYHPYRMGPGPHGRGRPFPLGPFPNRFQGPPWPRCPPRF